MISPRLNRALRGLACLLFLFVVPSVLWAQRPPSDDDVVETILKGLEAREQAVTNVTATAVALTYRSNFFYKDFDLQVRKAMQHDLPLRSDAEIMRLPHKDMVLLDMTLGRDTSEVTVQGMFGSGNRWFEIPVDVQDLGKLLMVSATDGQNVFSFTRSQGVPRVSVRRREGETPEYLRSPYGQWLGLAIGSRPLSQMVRTALEAKNHRVRPVTWIDHDTALLEAAYQPDGHPSGVGEVRLWISTVGGCTPQRFEFFAADLAEPGSGTRLICKWDDIATGPAGTPPFARRYRQERYSYLPDFTEAHTSTETVEFQDLSVNSTVPRRYNPWCPPGTLVVIDPHAVQSNSDLATAQERAMKLWGQAEVLKNAAPPEPDRQAAKPIGQADLDALLDRYQLSVAR